MGKLTRKDLLSLEEYTSQRTEFRARVMAHKKNRQVPLGPHVTLYFEDRLTIQYQIQEMLRVERIFEAQGIRDELEAYNPLVPDGSNWKATMMIEYPDAEQRKQALAELIGVEDRVWVRVDGMDRVWSIADEDLERETEEKTSAVHFLRFEFTLAMIGAIREGASAVIGIEHPAYTHEVTLPSPVRDALARDFG